MAWSQCDYLGNFIGKTIKDIEMDYGEGRLLITFDDGEIFIQAIEEGEPNHIPQLDISYENHIKNKIIL